MLAPVDRLDVAKLEPIEAVAVYIEDGDVVLRTDTKAEGRGESVELALENLKVNTTAVVYLDTARYLLVGENAEQQARQLKQYLKPTIRQGVYAGGDVKEEARYLDAHSEGAKPKVNF